MSQAQRSGSDASRSGNGTASTLDKELAVEQAHVDLVYDRLAEATRSAEQVAREGRSLYQTDRGSYVREESGTGLFERDVFAFQAAKRLAVLDAEHEGLVFGRLDRTDREVRYVGRIGVRDHDYEPLVIDWRAPAAEPFYRATPANPMQVVRRRVLRCRGMRVVGIEDDLLDDSQADTVVVIGEGALMAALSRARGHTMRDIVATIQGEQDQAIRAPWQGFTTISGGPGTGKTVVALHRAAYLLYSNRRRFESGGVLVVGPSRVFMNYIERVLPSLGEDAVTLRAIGSVAADVVDVVGERTDPAPVAAVKGSLRMVTVLKRLVREPSRDLPTELAVTVLGHALVLRRDDLSRIRSEVLAHHKLNQARDAVEKALLTALWRRRPTELDLERDDFDDRVSDTGPFVTFLSDWWPPMSAEAALRRLGRVEVLADVASSVLSAADQGLLADSYAGAEGYRAADWSAADAALLDELVHLLGPMPAQDDRDAPTFLDAESDVRELVTTVERMTPAREVDPFATPQETYAHILVDEAQDISPMQWRMLRRRGGSASWTIVGDPAQSSWPVPEEAARALRDIIGTAPQRRFRMSTNYRSPAEVFDLAAQVAVRAFPEADLPKAVRSTGHQPELVETNGAGLEATVVGRAQQLLTQVEGTVGVVTPPSRLDRVRAALAPLADDRLVVVTAVQAKGLEYDAVVVVTPDDVVAESPGGARSLYVALTRPTQRLVTIDEQPQARWRAALAEPAVG